MGRVNEGILTSHEGRNLPRGRRLGAKNRIKKDEIGKLIEKIIPTRRRVELLKELAEGVKAIDKTGRVYTERPDRDAIRQLNEYQYGKPVQYNQLGIDDDSPIPIIVVPPQRKTFKVVGDSGGSAAPMRKR